MMDTIYRQTNSIGELVGTSFTNEMVILHRRKNSVGKTVKCCSELTHDFIISFHHHHYVTLTNHLQLPNNYIIS
jgi:hypothetical protein